MYQCHQYMLKSVSVKIKYHFPGDFKIPVHYYMPKYSVTQVVAKMAAMGTDNLWFCSWNEKSMIARVIEFDETLWLKLLMTVKSVYHCGNIKIPKSVPGEIKVLQNDIVELCEHKVKLMCEMPSFTLHARSTGPDFVDFPVLWGNAVRALRTTYQLCRRKASEILVWLLSDTDRLWKVEVPHALPVSWAMKGYRMPMNIMRKMMDGILNECAKKNIHVACTSFEGAFFPLVTGSACGEPLTILQLSLDLWKDLCSNSRDQVVQLLGTVKLQLKCSKFDGKIIIRCTLMTWLHKFLSRRVCAVVTRIPEPGYLDHEKVAPNNDYLGTLPIAALEMIEAAEQNMQDMSEINSGHVQYMLTVDHLELIFRHLKNHTSRCCGRMEGRQITKDDKSHKEISQCSILNETSCCGAQRHHYTHKNPAKWFWYSNNNLFMVESRWSQCLVEAIRWQVTGREKTCSCWQGVYTQWAGW